MQLELTDDQRMLVASAEDWLAAHPAADGAGDGVARWRAFAGLGWLAQPFGADVGGLDGAPLDCGLLMHTLGRHLEVLPCAGALHVAGRLLDRLGSPDQRSEWLPQLIDGQLRPALAHAERDVAWPWAPRRFQAWRSGSGWTLRGEKLLVADMPAPTHWLISATCDDGSDVMFLLPVQAAAVQGRYRTLSGGWACDLDFDGLWVGPQALVGEGVPAADALHEPLSAGLLAQCWAAAGVIDALVSRTAAYVGDRRQFGRALAEFQVVQHRLAEMEVERQEARAACELASMRAAAGEPLGPLASGAKLRVGAAADVVAKQAIQLHGAMGVCEELPVAAAFRWLAAFQADFGPTSLHALQLGRQLRGGERLGRSAVLGAAA